MSNKAEQLRHIYGGYDRSIDAPAGIRGRTGDVEDGDTLGSLLRDDSATAEDLLLASEDREPRIKFLRQFFALLKQTLSPEEFKFIKLRFTKKKTDKQIAVWLGFKSVSGVFASIKNKLRAQERTIKRIAERSQWDGATLFVRQITTSVNELSRDESVIKSKVPTPAHGYYAMQQAIERAEARENASEESKIRRRFYMRGVYQSGAILTEYSGALQELISKCRFGLQAFLGYIDALYTWVEYKNPQQGDPNAAEELKRLRADFREYFAMLNIELNNPRDEIFDLVAEKLAETIARQDLSAENIHANLHERKRRLAAKLQARRDFLNQLPCVKKADEIARARMEEIRLHEQAQSANIEIDRDFQKFQSRSTGQKRRRAMEYQKRMEATPVARLLPGT